MLSKVVRGESTPDPGSEVNLLIASGITRFGILFVVIYIMQVLVNLYRYTMRLSAHYVALSDALLLAQNNIEILTEIVPTLSPTQVDFGKQPNTPLEQFSKVVDLVKKAKE